MYYISVDEENNYGYDALDDVNTVGILTTYNKIRINVEVI